jgi:hypothetical protein
VKPSKAIKAREAKKNSVEFTFLELKSAHTTKAEMKAAWPTSRHFQSQVMAGYDPAGAVIRGVQRKVTEIWTFARDTHSSVELELDRHVERREEAFETGRFGCKLFLPIFARTCRVRGAIAGSRAGGCGVLWRRLPANPSTGSDSELVATVPPIVQSLPTTFPIQIASALPSCKAGRKAILARRS